ncbi:hypothetical protein A2U01_0081392 [Trifolium medium]|uniref:Uncharacterized protein n=1 Tax=Trifolium medium TaxID=97028 RepID=A0A392TI81_9FABA|nr:hypothetical protein [Trifolium medium]
MTVVEVGDRCERGGENSGVRERANGDGDVMLAAVAVVNSGETAGGYGEQARERARTMKEMVNWENKQK